MIMLTRGIRGATTVMKDHPEAITSATLELLQAILEANPELETEALASVFFTVTDDLSSTYPAIAARQLGWSLVPLLCAREIPVPGFLPRCIRVLLHWNTGLSQDEIIHVYLRDAVTLRPDLAAGSTTDP
jgi:chorismate mutase